MARPFAVDEALVRLGDAGLTRASFSIYGQRLCILTDDPLLDRHFRVRLAPFLAPSRPGSAGPQACVAALTTPEHIQGCGLAAAEDCDQLDRVLVLQRAVGRDCAVAISLPDRAALFGVSGASLDRYWLVDLIAEVLPGMLLAGRVVMVHASAVAASGGAVLFVGPSGSGKSTLGVWAAERLGWAFLSDDKTLLRLDDDGAVRACALYTDLHFDAGTLARVPSLQGHVSGDRRGRDVTGTFVTRDPEEQAEFRMAAPELWPAWQPLRVPAMTVIFPATAREHERCQVAPLSAARAWDRISPLAMPFLGDHWPYVVEREREVLKAALQQCACWQLCLSPCMEGLERTLAEVVKDV